MDQDDHDDKQKRLREENKMLLNKYDKIFMFTPFIINPDCFLTLHFEISNNFFY